MTSLEEQFQESEKQRLQAEQLKKRREQRLPTTETEKFLSLFENSEIGAQYSHLTGVVDLGKVAAEVKEAVDQLPIELQTQFQSILDRFLQVLGEVQRRQLSMEQKLDADLDARQKMRKKENEVLDKLNQYLENWL